MRNSMDTTHPKGRLMAALLGLAVAANAQETDVLCQVRVVTDPPEAAVSCDGIGRGTAPVTLSDLSPGDHLLIATKHGHHEARRTVSLTPGQKMVAELQLEPILGLMLVHSHPVGAEVQINGADRGRTPLLVTDLPIGRHRVRLSAVGYQPKQIDLHIQDRTPIKIAARLTSDSAALDIRSEPPGADVLLGGVAEGKTPCRVERVAPGECILDLRLEGYSPYRQALRLRAGQTETVNAVLQPIPASLRAVTIPPWARVYLDDEFQGESPVDLNGLQPGQHRLRAELRGHEPSTRTVTLVRAQTAVEELRLTRNCGIFELTTEPVGVKVFIDGDQVGFTRGKASETDRVSEPFQVDLLPIGRHKVQLTLKGHYDEAFMIEVKRDETVTVHKRMRRRFIPDCEVRTEREVHQGVLVEVAPNGDVKLEVRPGIIRTIPGDQVISRKPIRRHLPAAPGIPSP